MDTFDPKKFVENLDPSLRDQVLAEGIFDSFQEVYGRLGPMIWALAFKEMQKDSSNTMHLNAVLNAVVSSAVMLAVAMGAADKDFLPDLKAKICANLDNAAADADTVKQLVAQAGMGVGTALLWQEMSKSNHDCLKEVSTALQWLLKGVEALHRRLD